jgi:hypothetical protein
LVLHDDQWLLVRSVFAESPLLPRAAATRDRLKSASFPNCFSFLRY